MGKQLQKYGGKNKAFTESIDKMHTNEFCCGTNGTQYWTTVGKVIPDSCYCEKKTVDYFKLECLLDIFDHVRSYKSTDSYYEDFRKTLIHCKCGNKKDSGCQKYSRGANSYKELCINTKIILKLPLTKYWSWVKKDLTQSCLNIEYYKGLPKKCEKDCNEAIMEDLRTLHPEVPEYWIKLAKKVLYTCRCKKKTDSYCQKYTKFAEYNYVTHCIEKVFLKDLETLMGASKKEYWTRFGKNIPYSCQLICQETDPYCQKDSTGKWSFNRGCVEALIDGLKIYKLVLGVLALFLAFAMFLSMISAFGLAKRINYE